LRKGLPDIFLQTIQTQPPHHLPAQTGALLIIIRKAIIYLVFVVAVIIITTTYYCLFLWRFPNPCAEAVLRHTACFTVFGHIPLPEELPPNSFAEVDFNLARPYKA
jgi:hypothetical protein